MIKRGSHKVYYWEGVVGNDDFVAKCVKPQNQYINSNDEKYKKSSRNFVYSEIFIRFESEMYPSCNGIAF